MFLHNLTPPKPSPILGFISPLAFDVDSDSDEEGDDMDGPEGENNPPPVTMAGVGPPPAGPECLVQAVLMEVLVILVSSGDKHADRAVVEAVWELLHEFEAMCRLLSNVRSPCLPLAKASMQLLTKMHNSKRFSVGPRSILQVCYCPSWLWVWWCALLSCMFPVGWSRGGSSVCVSGRA